MFVKVLARLEVIPTGEVKPDAEAEPKDQQETISMCFKQTDFYSLLSIASSILTSLKFVNPCGEIGEIKWNPFSVWADMVALVGSLWFWGRLCGSTAGWYCKFAKTSVIPNGETLKRSTSIFQPKCVLRRFQHHSGLDQRYFRSRQMNSDCVKNLTTTEVKHVVKGDYLR